MSTIPFDARRFRSTAEYYARYRVPYADSLIEAVAARVGLEPGDAVLDLGCGPGMLGIAFARLGMRVTAIDPEPEMLAAARGAASAAGVSLQFVEGSSYDLGTALGRFQLVVMGRSFHWMDRLATLAALDGLVEPGGAVGLFHDRRIATSPDWMKPLGELSEKFSPGHSETRHFRRTDGWLPHEGVLLQSPFSAVETVGRVFSRDLTADDIVGRAYSMSVTSPEALGDKRAAFEAELRGALATLAPDGRFSEIVGTDAILAFRPGEVPVGRKGRSEETPANSSDRQDRFTYGEGDLILEVDDEDIGKEDGDEDQA